MSILKKLLFLTKAPRYKLDQITYRWTGNREKLGEWKAKYKGKPLVIVGNGPSLNKTPLDKFSGIPAVGMNKIDLLFKRVSWRPTVIVCTNNLVVKQHHGAMASHGISCLLSWKSRWFMPFKDRGDFIFFLNDATSEFSEDFSDKVGAAGTVTYTALQLAAYVEANPIILLGVDHNFSCSGKPNDIQKREGEDANHFDPNYFAAGQYWGLPNLDKSELGYRVARRYFDERNIKIYDATVGGKLDVFEKISIEEALELCGLPAQ